MILSLVKKNKIKQVAKTESDTEAEYGFSWAAPSSTFNSWATTAAQKYT
jgi:hypothetical protein